MRSIRYQLWIRRESLEECSRSFHVFSFFPLGDGLETIESWSDLVVYFMEIVQKTL